VDVGHQDNVERQCVGELRGLSEGEGGRGRERADHAAHYCTQGCCRRGARRSASSVVVIIIIIFVSHAAIVVVDDIDIDIDIYIEIGVDSDCISVVGASGIACCIQSGAGGERRLGVARRHVDDEWRAAKGSDAGDASRQGHQRRRT
jgi:hypothetical protein